jgi:hypothetical protein
MPAAVVGFARWYHRGHHFPLYQLIWPNNDGHYPRSEHASEILQGMPSRARRSAHRHLTCESPQSG